MGRKERKRFADNEAVSELLKKDKHTAEEIEFIKEAYTGVGGLVSSGWDSGQFFTPSVVTEFIVKILRIESGTVLEPSCGGGAFLRALPERCQITGIEYMHETAKVSTVCYPRALIMNEDALKVKFSHQFDYVIGNPPYGLKVDDWDFDSGKKAKSEIAFLEYGLRNLREGGLLAMVIPDSVLQGQATAAFRKYIMEEHNLVGIISLPIETFSKAGTKVKTSVMVIKKGRHIFHEHQQVLMAVCKDIGWDSRGNETGKCDLPMIADEFSNFLDGQDMMNMQLAVAHAMQAIEDGEGESFTIPVSDSDTTPDVTEPPEEKPAPAVAKKVPKKKAVLEGQLELV